MVQTGAKPRVSICGQVFNQSEWLREMIASVVAQTYPEWELLLVDDGSTEDIKAVVDSFNDPRIKLHRFDENRNVPHGVNHAMREAQGEFIGMLAADEVLSPEKLEEQIKYLDEHPGVSAVWGIPGRGDMGERPEWEQYYFKAYNRSNEQWVKTLLNLETVPIGGASMLMRTEVMRTLDYMDETLTVFSDHDLYTRFFAAGYVGVVLPYRWAKDKPMTDQSVRAKNGHKGEAELAYVRSKTPLVPPKVGGKVTVGIPCYNQGKYLRAAVDSICAQTYTDLEILVLDDGSTDETKEVIAGITDERVKGLAFEKNMGLQEALSQMAFRASGEFFVVLSADDTVEPTLIERQMKEFEADPWLEMVSTQTDFMDEAGVKMDPDKPPSDTARAMMSIVKPVNKPREQWLAELYMGNQYFGSSMYRTMSISQVGGWKKQFGVLSDYEMYIGLLQRGEIKIIEEPLTHTRIHGKNYSILSPERAALLPLLYSAVRRKYYVPRMKVVICTPFYELKGFSPYIQSLVMTIRLLTMHNIDWNFMELSGDSYVHRARNTMCDRFLEDPDATDLFFIDSDMSWNPESFVKMCLLPHEVVGGAYPVKNNWGAWTSIPKQHEEDGKLHLRGQELGDGTALVEAHVLAGGFLRIKRSVLERYRKHYKDLWYIEPSTRADDPQRKYTAFFQAESIDNRFYGEDHMFSKRLRDMGTDMFIYPNVDIIHWGYKEFPGNYDKFLKGQATPNQVEQPKAN